MPDPYKITVESTPTQQTDLNETHRTLLSSIAERFAALGHTVHRIRLDHGSLRGGAKTWKPGDDAPTDELVAHVTPAPH
jgi:hypothetical protein